jgi:hypothetical protein
MTTAVSPRATRMDSVLLDLALERLRASWWDDTVRDATLAEIREETLRIGVDRLPPHLTDEGSPEAMLLDIALHASNVLDGFAVRLEPAPYVMTVAARGHRGPRIGVDADGFRVTLADGAPLSRAGFEAWGGDRVLVVGNSTSFGVGASGDGAHVASALNLLRPDMRAFNASVKGSNLLQQAIVAEQRLPEGADLAIVAGALDLIYALSWPRDESHGALSFWAAGDADLTGDGPYTLKPGAYDGDAACEAMRRAIESMGRTVRARGGRALFLLQPHLDLAGKRVTPLELRLARALSTELGAFRPVHACGALQAHRALFPRWLAGVCAAAGIDFIDLNATVAITGDAFLFLDHIHVNDRGHRHMASAIATWAEGALFDAPPPRQEVPGPGTNGPDEDVVLFV